MNPARTIVYVLGGLLVVFGIGMLLLWSEVAAWIPASIAVSGLVILVGLLVLAFGESFTRERRIERREYEEHEPRY